MNSKHITTVILKMQYPGCYLRHNQNLIYLNELQCTLLVKTIMDILLLEAK